MNIIYNVYILKYIFYLFFQNERQQIENLKESHKKEITNKDECIKRLQDKSLLEDKKTLDIQNEFEKKIKSKCSVYQCFYYNYKVNIYICLKTFKII